MVEIISGRFVLDVTNKIKQSQAPPTAWSKMCIRTVKKKNGSINDLKSCSGAFISSTVSLIFENS